MPCHSNSLQVLLYLRVWQHIRASVIHPLRIVQLRAGHKPLAAAVRERSNIVVLSTALELQVAHKLHRHYHLSLWSAALCSSKC